MLKREIERRYQLWYNSKGFFWRLFNRLFPKWVKGPIIIQRLNLVRARNDYVNYPDDHDISITEAFGPILAFPNLIIVEDVILTPYLHTELFNQHSRAIDQLFGPWLYQNELTTDHLGVPFSPLRIQPAQLIVLDAYAFSHDELNSILTFRSTNSNASEDFNREHLFNNPHTGTAFSRYAKRMLISLFRQHFIAHFTEAELMPPRQRRARMEILTSRDGRDEEQILSPYRLGSLREPATTDDWDSEDESGDYSEVATKQQEEKYRNAQTFMCEDVKDITPENLLVLDRYAFDKTELLDYFKRDLSHLFKNPHHDGDNNAQNFTDAAIAQLRSTPEFQTFFKAHDEHLAKQNDAIPREFISQLTTLLKVYLAQTPRDNTFAMRNFNESNPAEMQALRTCHDAKTNFNAYLLRLDTTAQQAINNYVITIYFRHSNANVSERFQSINDASKTGGCIISEQRFLWRMLKALSPEVTIPKALKRHPDVNLYDLERNGQLSNAELTAQRRAPQRLMAAEEDAAQSTRLHWLMQRNHQLQMRFFLLNHSQASSDGDVSQHVQPSRALPATHVPHNHRNDHRRPGRGG